MASWSRPKSPARRLGPPQARIVERLGSAEAPGAFSLLAIAQFDIPDRISPGRARRGRGRRDCRRPTAEPTCAISRWSPSTAPMPAISTTRFGPSPTPTRPIPAAGIIVVAIADVAFYVQPGSALDREAARARQLRLFPRPRRADAARGAVERAVLASARRGPRLPRRRICGSTATAANAATASSAD